jgi:hypothetical protein
MWIESLRLRNYSPFDGERTISFARDRTVVAGPNASGKTRLVAALRGTFFGFAEAVTPEDGFAEAVFHLGSRIFLLRRGGPAVRLAERAAGDELLHEGNARSGCRRRSRNLPFLGASERCEQVRPGQGGIWRILDGRSAPGWSELKATRKRF